MITIEELRSFCIIVSSSSLADAARKMNISTSAVSQRLKQAESRIGVRLLNRNSKYFGPTDEGILLAERGRDLVDAHDELCATLAQHRNNIIGHLRVLAPFGFGRQYVGPALAEFQNINPDLSVDLVLSDKLGGHPHQSYDLVIHVGELRDSSLVVNRIAPNHSVICAAPDYLDRKGTPTHPNELAKHDCLILRENDEDSSLWKFYQDDNEFPIRVQEKMSSNDGHVIEKWAVCGLGLIKRSAWSVTNELKAGHLVRILEDYSLPQADVVALLPSRMGRTGRAESFLKYLKSSLNPAPWLHL